MISLNNIYLQYGDRILLDRINFSIGTRDRLGLVGRNGAGKSTLLKLIYGHAKPDEGSIVIPGSSTLGFLHQDLEVGLGKSVIDETLTAFAKILAMEERMQEINKELEVRTDYESDSYANLITELSETSEQLAVLDGDTLEAKAAKVLSGLGFQQNELHNLTDTFSGGWQMRIELAKILLQRPDYLLLDEPTNHLDIESIIWLEQFLQTYEGSVIIVSHDKMFLDNVTTRTVEVELGQVYDYKANYSQYLELRKERREKQQSAFQNQQKKIEHTEKLIEKFRAKANKAKMAQSLIKQLAKVDRIEVDSPDSSVMKLRFKEPPRSGEVVFEGLKVEKSYGDKLVLNKVDFNLIRGDKVAFVGQNGQGKTTLTRIICGELEASGGQIQPGYNMHLGYYAQNQAETLNPNITLLKTLENAAPEATQSSLRNILGNFMFSGEDVDKKVVVLSGGERARLALAVLTLKPINLLILDEPTNHLDMLSKDVLKQAVKNYTGSLIIVSHDRDFLAGLTDRTLEFRDKKLFEHLGDVMYFLEKRALDNMRDVEIGGNKKQKKVHSETKKKVMLSDKEKKQLERNLHNAEKKVEKLEARIQKAETEMAETGFYERADSAEKLEKYQKLKVDLDIAMEQWDAAAEALG